MNLVYDIKKGHRRIAGLYPPLITEESGMEAGLSLEGPAFYQGMGYEVKEQITDRGMGLISITRTLINRNTDVRRVKLILAVRTLFTPDRYLIPCVNYNGNQWGEGKEPKGMLADNGEPWIFSYDRTGIPSCSLTENEEIALSVFTSAGRRESLCSAVSIVPDGQGELCQRIYYPVTEAPYTYSDNDTYTERYEEYFTLFPEESVCTEAFVLVGTPRWRNYGICDTLDRVLKLFPYLGNPVPGFEEIWKNGIAFARSLVTKARDGRTISSTGIRYFPETGEKKLSPKQEIGWCGQNLMSCRMQIMEFIRTGGQALLKDALEILDSWTAKQADNGLILSHYNWYTQGKDWNYVPRDKNLSWASHIDYSRAWLPETCNMGWAASEMIKNYKLLLDIGINRAQYRDFAIRICDFFMEHFSTEYGFGKSWRFDGTPEDTQGSIGIFITLALLEVYEAVGNEEYLRMAARSLDFYVKRDLDEFVCTAGAIDCTCVDKETAGPFLIASLNLYELTKKEKYLEYAKKAAYYFTSWMFHYDVWYPSEAEFSKYGYRTAGGTAVSVQHPALDPWGELLVPDYLRLYRITGDDAWKVRAGMMWNNSTQLITTEDTPPIHGMKRPVGSQNEAYYQCRWGHRKDCNDRGHLNDWFVAWVNLFRLNTIIRLREYGLTEELRRR